MGPGISLQTNHTPIRHCRQRPPSHCCSVAVARPRPALHRRRHIATDLTTAAVVGCTAARTARSSAAQPSTANAAKHLIPAVCAAPSPQNHPAGNTAQRQQIGPERSPIRIQIPGARRQGGSRPWASQEKKGGSDDGNNSKINNKTTTTKLGIPVTVGNHPGTLTTSRNQTKRNIHPAQHTETTAAELDPVAEH